MKIEKQSLFNRRCLCALWLSKNRIGAILQVILLFRLKKHLFRRIFELNFDLLSIIFLENHSFSSQSLLAFNYLPFWYSIGIVRLFFDCLVIILAWSVQSMEVDPCLRLAEVDWENKVTFKSSNCSARNNVYITLWHFYSHWYLFSLFDNCTLRDGMVIDSK